jgi:hypothetical protein
VKRFPPIGSRVHVTYSEATEGNPARECFGKVVTHYPSDGIRHTDPETGLPWVSDDAITVQVDRPLPAWWPYPGTDLFCPPLSEVKPA